jgi:hypothetical protein
VKNLAAALMMAAAVAANGCSDQTGPCPPVFCPGLHVRVQNGETGESICDAVVTARDGGRFYTLVPLAAGSCDYVGVGQPGTYVVAAERSGFSSSARPGIRLVGSGGECPCLQTVELTIGLTPSR